MKLLRDTFKALADETRLQIMTLLLDNDELCVCDFVGALGQTQSKISRHLRYLYNAGLVQDRREGLWMHYRISSKLDPEQQTILRALSEAVGEDEKRDLHAALERWFGEKTGCDGGRMIEVKVFGAEPPCVKCKQSEQEARKAAAKFPGQVTVEKLSALSPEGVQFGFVMTPAVVVNGRVVSQGRVPQEAELERILQAELGG